MAVLSVVAVVAPDRSAARRAARRAGPMLAGARALPTTLAEYLRSCDATGPLDVVLAASGSDPDADRLFLAAARERLLWRRPAPEVYDAISGLRTDLPPRKRSGKRRPAADEPYLLLEGTVTAARAARALASPVRNWVVEHVGTVRIGERALSRLAARGVRWSVLRPVRLLGVVNSETAGKRVRDRASGAP